MKRTSDMGLLVLGIVLAVVGAILRFAVVVTTEGFNIHTAGVILLVVGILAALVGLILLFMGTTSRSVVTARTVDTPTGQMRVEERSDSMPPG
ncbi:MAG TPA: hypothetical protein DCY40_05695 [Actinobacteria bacterium]|nr:hypothetical protein [Actinomycetota bacterium]